MVRKKTQNQSDIPEKLSGKTPEEIESEMITDAMLLAGKQLREGTASSQVIVHFLKLGTTKANLEREKVALENELLRAKTEACKSNERIEDLYKDAIQAMQSYIPTGDDHA